MVSTFKSREKPESEKNGSNLRNNVEGPVGEIAYCGVSCTGQKKKNDGDGR